MERAAEVGQFCDEHGIHFIAGIEPDKPEDISDVERALAARQYDGQFRVVFEAIRELMTQPPATKRPIGFQLDEHK